VVSILNGRKCRIGGRGWIRFGALPSAYLMRTEVPLISVSSILWLTEIKATSVGRIWPMVVR
jgi:hypothetical protein